MNQGPRTTRPRNREPLTRARIINAALELGDHAGLEKLSMRALASELGVEAMSLYYHFANRDEILDGLVDRIYKQFPLPVEGRDWRAELRQRSVGARLALLQHPWAIPLLNSRRSPGPATLRQLDAVIGCLRSNGFSHELTAHAFALLDAHLIGFLTQEATLPFSGNAELSVVADEIGSDDALAELPHFAQFVSQHVLQPGYEFGGTEFEWGLDLILDALERELAEA